MMARSRLEAWRRRLIQRRRTLLGDVACMREAAINDARRGVDGQQSIRPYHMADSASAAYDQELMFDLIQSEEADLAAIDHALAKIEEGTYGICENCGRRIRLARLRVIPEASLCIKCKRLSERGLRK